MIHVVLYRAMQHDVVRALDADGVLVENSIIKLL